MSNAAVDEYVRTRVLPQHQPTVAALRELMGQCAADATEVIAYGSPAWTGKRTRHVKLASPDTLDRDALRDLINQAGDLDRRS